MIDVEIVFALPDSATVIKTQCEEGATVEQAIDASGILGRCPEIDKENLSVGIWNRTCKLHQSVRAGDRIEIYRPLIADPKEARRRRAEKAKEDGRANKVTGGRAGRPQS